MTTRTCPPSNSNVLHQMVLHSSICQIFLNVCVHECTLQNTPVGRSIFMVNATDPDQGTGGSVLFSFQPLSPFFTIDGARGTVTVTKPLDYETTSAYQLTVNATVSKNVYISTRLIQIGTKMLWRSQLFGFFLGSRQTEASVPAGKLGY